MLLSLFIYIYIIKKNIYIHLMINNRIKNNFIAALFNEIKITFITVRESKYICIINYFIP